MAKSPAERIRQILASTPPLVCGYCYARRWNDETVRWLPLRGDHRVPYCAVPCAVLVMTTRETERNGGLDVWEALMFDAREEARRG